MSPPRPEIRYQRVQDPRGEEEEEELTIYLHSQPSSPLIRQRCREAGFRIFSSVLLLMVAAGFVLYDLQSRNPEISDAQQRFLVLVEESSNTSRGPTSPTNHEKPEESHHHEDSGESQHREEPGESHHHEEEDGDGHSSPNHHHSEGTFHQVVAVTDSETCSMLVRDVLQSGGSVVDAGISAVLCLVVVHPHTSSLGGIFSSIYFSSASRNASILNAIPMESSPVSYGVPQVLQGLRVLHQKFGKKPWSELVSSAVVLADEGFLVDSSLHSALVANREKVVSSEGLRSFFCDPDQNLKDVGERVQNPTLGKVLARIASSVSDSGLLDDLIQSQTSDFGVTEKKRFTEAISRPPSIEDPVTLHLDSLTLFTTGGPTAGTILSNAVQKIYSEKQVLSVESSSELLLNSSKTVYALSGAWPRSLQSKSSPPQIPPWTPAPVGSNVMMADVHGDIFVLSLTINSTFGSGFVSPTGVLLSDFVWGQGSAQSFGPLYWACPAVLIYGADNDVMGLSAYGGSPAPFSLTRVIISHLLLEMDLAESVTGSLGEVPPESSDPWLGYFGLQGNITEPVVAVEVQAEHVHVMKSHGPCCYPAGL